MPARQKPQDCGQNHDERQDAHRADGLASCFRWPVGTAHPNTLGLVADPGSRQPYGLTHATLADVGRQAVATNRERAAFLGKVDPEAWEELDAFTKSDSHRFLVPLLRTTY